MHTAEFQIRAWPKDQTHAQVLVHSSPAGDIRKPLTVPCDLRRLADVRNLFQTNGWYMQPRLEHQLVDIGHQLAEVLLPRPVYALLSSSLQTIAPDDILRIRLCLEPELIDLPWDYLYRPDVGPDASLTGFLLFDHRISLVREAPMTLSVPPLFQERQRMLFAGALWSYGEDRWGVGIEYIKLAKALESVNQFLGLEFITASGNNIAAALKEPASIFHYSGHTDAEKGRGYLVREVNPQSSGALQTMYIPMYSEELANLLPNAQTRLAVFSACNSGRWVFAEPLLRAGLPALVGTQGSVSVQGASMFSEKLYAALAVGLTLDEAIIGARFQLLKEGGFNGHESLEWGTFMVYMPATDATLLPRAKEQSNATSFQEAARQTSQQTITAVTQRMGPAPQTASAVDQRSLRNAIVERFTVEEEATLFADIKLDLENDGVALDLDLDTVGGPAHGEEAMVQKLISYLDRRGYLSYLVNAVRRARPGAI